MASVLDDCVMLCALRRRRVNRAMQRVDVVAGTAVGSWCGGAVRAGVDIEQRKQP